jgi:hypothetical protein
MQPVSPKVGTGDFALAAGHRLTAVRRLLDTPNSVAAFSMAVASSDASTVPSQTAGAAIFQMLYLARLSGDDEPGRERFDFHCGEKIGR